MRKIICLCCMLLCLLLYVPPVFAAEAEEISGKELVTGFSGFSAVNRLFDGRTMESLGIKNGGHITLADERGIGSLYLEFGLEYGDITVTDDTSGESKGFGGTGFLHEFLDLEEAFGYAPKAVTVSFGDGEAQLSELSVFTSGQVPDWVQQWQPPAEGESDLVLFATHGDDDQLFFAGMLPYYAAELGYNVQVVYMTDHRNMTLYRCHEMLDGLWAVGVRRYPVLGTFGDYNTRSLAEAYQKYSYKGIQREDILSFVVENIRRFRPKVAVGHDLQGEYGHGMHMVYADVLCEAVTISHDPSQFPESAETYGLWDVPKTYLHLYPEHQIRMNWDVPLECFDGMTAYEVTKELGFPCHVSQQTYYSWYFSGMDTAADIREYSPCEFGLYRSTVGADREKNDFFEHLTTHSQDAQLEAIWQVEEEARQEEARLARETVAQTETIGTVPVQTPVSEEPEMQASKMPLLISAGILPVLLILILIVRIKNEKNAGKKNF